MGLNVLGLLFLGACVAAPEAPLDIDQIAADVSARANSPAALEEGLRIAGIEPLAIAPPAPAANDGGDPEFWRACAWVWAPGPRRARRALEASRALAGGAGLPGPVGGSALASELGDPFDNGHTQATVDILGIMGLGPAAAARTLADAEVRAAVGELERTLWDAEFAVEEARVRLGLEQERAKRLEALLQEVRHDGQRVDILDARGWIAPARASVARGLTHRVALASSRSLETIATRKAELARAAGLVPDSTQLDQVVSLDESAATGDLVIPSRAQLVQRHPQLRSLCLEYGLAEARVRATAAQAWPDLRVGPRFSWRPDEVLLGGVLDISIPWPGVVEAKVAAAVARREGVRERLEDSLVAVSTRLTEARANFRSARRRLVEESLPLEARTAEAWRAARAHFSTDTQAITGWFDTLERRLDGLLASLEARETAALARLQWREALGPVDTGSQP